MLVRMTVLVTGGTGALGSEVVSAFLAGGARVVVPWIVKAEQTACERRFAAEIEAQRLALVEADVATEDGAQAAARAAGESRVLVNAAGGFDGGAPIWESDLAVFERMFRINLLTAAAMSRAVLPFMLERGRGCIVNVSSRAASDTPAGLAAYSASKSGVAVLTSTLQAEVAGRGVRVNAVVPSTIDTPANRAAMPDADFATWTPPARIASVICWLASEEAETVRGALIPV